MIVLRNGLLLLGFFSTHPQLLLSCLHMRRQLTCFMQTKCQLMNTKCSLTLLPRYKSRKSKIVKIISQKNLISMIGRSWGKIENKLQIHDVTNAEHKPLRSCFFSFSIPGLEDLLSSRVVWWCGKFWFVDPLTPHTFLSISFNFHLMRLLLQRLS